MPTLTYPQQATSTTFNNSFTGTAWSNPSNATGGPNDTWASIELSHGSTSQCLYVYDFDFGDDYSNYSTWTVDGIIVRVERHSDSGQIRDNALYMVNDQGNYTGNNKSTGLYFNTSDTIQAYGSPTDTWGYGALPLTISDMVNWGFMIQVVNQGAYVQTDTAYIDSIGIYLYASQDGCKIYRGTQCVNKIFYGTNPVTRVYRGTTRIV